MAKKTALSIRAMNRDRINAAILVAAREQIAAGGATSLSMRAIARELEMASSALYRYFDSRDVLLTKLIVDSYDSLGQAVEDAEARIPREDLRQRFRTICHAVRDWSLANQHEYFLIYGTPVPGYKAPEDTIAPATRVASLMITLMVEAVSVPGESAPDAVEPSLNRALAPMRKSVPASVSDSDMAAGLSIFSAIFGAISFELGGQLHNVITETQSSRSVYFDSQIDGWLRSLGW